MSMAMMWSWILSIVGVTGLYLVGRRHWWGWCIAFINECLWCIYAVTTEQYGFILGAVAYGFIHLVNATRWRGESPVTPVDS